MTDGAGIKGFWQDRFQSERFTSQLAACIANAERLNESQAQFVLSMKRRYKEREEIAAMTGYDWTPSAAQLNYLNSIYDKVSR